MMSNTKFRCVPCVIDSYPVYPKRQALDPIDAASVGSSTRRPGAEGDCGGAGWVCAQLFPCFFPVWKWDPQLGVCQHTPGLGERWAWLLLLWLSNSDGFGHFCGRRGSSYRYVAIEEGEAISKQTWLLFSWGLASNFR